MGTLTQAWDPETHRNELKTVTFQLAPGRILG